MEPVVLEIVDVHSRSGERKSELAPDAVGVPVTVTEVIAIMKGVDSTIQMTLSTIDPMATERYEVGGTIEVKMWAKKAQVQPTLPFPGMQVGGKLRMSGDLTVTHNEADEG